MAGIAFHTGLVLNEVLAELGLKEVVQLVLSLLLFLGRQCR